MTPKTGDTFHGSYDAGTALSPTAANTPSQSTDVASKPDGRIHYRFSLHDHPFVGKLIERLNGSVTRLLAADTEIAPEEFFAAYKPANNPEASFCSSTPVVSVPPESYPVKELDFSMGGSYSVYNWELFCHLPLAIAIQLSKNQYFAEAQSWLHQLFDPTDDSNGPTPERFWKCRVFQATDVAQIENLLVNLKADSDPDQQARTIASIEAWKDKPFRPDIVARYRLSAYMYKIVMVYLDNLIAWGDSLFRQDTGESINEATQLYVLAANILGPRPQAVPKKGSLQPQTYAKLKANLDPFSNALVNLETDIPFDLAPDPAATSDNKQLAMIRSLGQTLYFCTPRNEKLLSYWDTVADRLFKIHNSLSFQGLFRQLPLFEPPIDPALLVRATAAGLDVSAVLRGINQPLPLVRFQFLLQKATEICQEVKTLGNNLLSAIEKEDNEALAIMRAKHERVILDMVKSVKTAQLLEACKAREGLEVSHKTGFERYQHYEKLLGKKENEIQLPVLDALNEGQLKSADEGFQTSEPTLQSRSIEIKIAEDIGGDSGGKKLNIYERDEMKKLKDARDQQQNAGEREQWAAGIGIFPNPSINSAPLGVGATVSSSLTRAASFWASFARATADKYTYEANKAARVGSFERREQEWALQSNLAAGEVSQIIKQLRAAQIREAVADYELENHRQQIQHAQEIEQFLTDEKSGKLTNQAFYAWLRREVKGLYGQVFQFAFDIAKKAERALQHELGDPNLSFIQYNYLTGKEGLLAGEKLYLDIKRMEMAYHELNQREYELTKHISLLQVDPLALLQLRATGRCEVSLPEALFDLDGPGHYFRRIKSVAVSIPCVAGPYTSVNCTLKLTKSSIRKTSLLLDNKYERESTEDDRFSDYNGSLQSIVTSSGQNDSGLFETNLHDERYLPFEGSGVISTWQLELPANPSKNEPSQFDYDTISDVILHVRYTAREGGNPLRSAAIGNLTKMIKDSAAAGSVRLFSIRHEFPTAWAKFKNQQIDTNKFAELTLSLKAEHYPFWSKGRLEDVAKAQLFASGVKTDVTVSSQPDGSGETDAISKTGGESIGNLRGCTLEKTRPQKPDEVLTRYLSDNSMENLWLAITWGPKP